VWTEVWCIVGVERTRAVAAAGLAASSPLTWHAALRLPGAGRDDVEDLGGASIGGAVGSFGDSTSSYTAGQPGPRRAGDVVVLPPVSLGLHCSGVLASQRWGDKEQSGGI